MATQMKIITNATDLGKAIDAWGKAGRKWANQGHVLAVSALTRLRDYGDIGYCNRLYLSMPKGSKSAAMAEWMLTFGSLNANTEADKKTKPFLFASDKECDVSEGTANPWFNFQPEKEADQVLNIRDAVLAILKKAAKSKNTEHGDLVPMLAALVADDEAAGNPNAEDVSELLS